MATSPKAPTLRGVISNCLQIIHDAPDTTTHVSVRLRPVNGQWQMVDASAGKFDTCAIPFEKADKCMVKELSADVSYEAATKFKDGTGWQEWSPPSEPLKLSSLRPTAPGAPLLEGVSDTSMRVRFAAPYGSASILISMQPVGEETDRKMLHSKDGSLSNSSDDILFKTADDAIAKGLSPDVLYEAQVAAMNDFGVGPFSPVSAPLKLSSLRLPAPGVPQLEAVSESSMRIHFAALHGCDHIVVWMRRVGETEWKAVDRKDGSLVTPSGSACFKPKDDAVVKGLLPNVSYEARVSANNAFGWSVMSAVSAPLELKDPDAVVVVGSSSWEERDQALRKRAIDVDDDDANTGALQGDKHKSKVVKHEQAKEEALCKQN